jgi:three-Cys-motif partner protein
VIGVNSDHKSSDWITEKTKPLTDSKEVRAASDVHYPGHPWSIVKLILLGGWVYVYTTIIPKHYPEYQYVDLLAGSGTTKIKETEDVVLGSAFVASTFAQKPFKNYVLIEKDPERFDALNKRVKLIQGKCTVLPGDCNTQIESVFINEKAHSLVFIDNEGFNVIWNTVEVVLRAKTDTLINFPTSMVPRTAAESRTSASLDLFYGDRSWSSARTREDFLEIYMQKLKNRFTDLRKSVPYVSHVRVGTGSYFYDIILICKMGPFVNAWDYLKKKLDWQDPKTIETTLDILMNRATRMDSFIKDLRNEVTSIGAKPHKKKTKQTLDQFIG